jgi:drug/metabolite transporter (DMT)-like permease
LSPTEFALVLASALLHAGWSASIKGSRDPLVFNLLQEVPVFVLAGAALPLLEWSEIPAPVWRWLALTSVAHAFYFYWMSRSYEHGDLTLIYPIARSTPAFLPLLAVPLFGEPVSAGGALGIAVVVGGMWLVHLGPGLGWRDFASPAARYAYLTLAATVVYSLADKGAMAGLARAPWSSPIPRAVTYFLLLSVASALLFVPLALRRRGLRQVVSAARTDLGTATAAWAASFLGYGLILKAFETAPASYVVAVRQTSVIFAILLGVSQLRERPGRPRVVGALFTVAGVALIALLGT